MFEKNTEEFKTKHEEALMYLQMQIKTFKSRAETSEMEFKNVNDKTAALQGMLYVYCFLFYDSL